MAKEVVQAKYFNDTAGRNACQRCVGAHRDDFFTTIGCTQDTVREFCDYPKVANPVETVPKGSVSWQQVSSGVKYMQLPQQIGRSLVYAQPTGVLLLVTEHASVDAVRVTSGEIQWSARLVPCGNMVAQNVMLSDDQARVYVGLARSPEPNEEVSNSHRTQRSCLIALDVASGASLWTWQSHHPDGGGHHRHSREGNHQQGKRRSNHSPSLRCRHWYCCYWEQVVAHRA